MSNTNKGLSCQGLSWIGGAFLGFAVYLLLWRAAEMSGLLALVIGLVVLAVTGFVLGAMFCAGEPVAEAPRAPRPSRTPAGAPGVAVTPGAGVAPEYAHDPRAEEAAEAAASAMIGDEETAAAIAGDGGRATIATYLDEAAKEAAPPAEEPGAEALEEELATRKPALMSAPQGEADNLKEIKGVGPKLEELLNQLGIWHFSQIAAWDEAEILWVESHLGRFRGRIERDDWVGQAKILATGGETEFSKRVEDGDVY